jgi:2-polyprenyl-3-methyl-5-hydroxy-6-metoxy-1,4-benzoquinol methylase
VKHLKDTSHMEPIEQSTIDSNKQEESNSEALFTPPLHIQRRALILSILLDFSISSVFDIGCSDGTLLSILLNGSQFLRVAGLDIDPIACNEATAACKPTIYDLENLKRRPCVAEIYQGSVTDVDERLLGYECITAIEVIEHLHPEELNAFPGTVFGGYRPKIVIVRYLGSG